MTFDDAPQALTEDECLGLLRSRDLGRIAFELDGEIEIFPVNYGIEGSIIVIRTSPGTKLNAVGTRPVAFEADSTRRLGERTKGTAVIIEGFLRNDRERVIGELSEYRGRRARTSGRWR